jgi:hypothetical protein
MRTASEVYVLALMIGATRRRMELGGTKRNDGTPRPFQL